MYVYMYIHIYIYTRMHDSTQHVLALDSRLCCIAVHRHRSTMKETQTQRPFYCYHYYFHVYYCY